MEQNELFVSVVPGVSSKQKCFSKEKSIACYPLRTRAAFEHLGEEQTHDVPLMLSMSPSTRRRLTYSRTIWRGFANFLIDTCSKNNIDPRESYTNQTNYCNSCLFIRVKHFCANCVFMIQFLWLLSCFLPPRYVKTNSSNCNLLPHNRPIIFPLCFVSIVASLSFWAHRKFCAYHSTGTSRLIQKRNTK